MTSLRTLENQIDRSLRNERLVATLSAAFSLLSVLLSMLGLYGVMTHVVGLRTREIGVRMALGAQAGQVLRMVLGSGLRLVIVGLLVGLTAALGLTRVLSSLLFGIGGSYPALLAAAALLLAIIALLACYIPAAAGSTCRSGEGVEVRVKPWFGIREPGFELVTSDE